MDAEPKYALDALDEVLRAMGCRGGGQPGGAWVWKAAARRPGHASYFAYVPDRGCAWIRQDHAVAGALRMGLDPHEVLRRVKEAGGEILEP